MKPDVFRLMCRAAAFMLLLALVPIRAAGYDRSADEIDGLISDIISYKLECSGADDIDGWIDGSLTDGAGVMSDWYIIALGQYGQYDMSSYRQALMGYISENNVHSAVTREKYALALCAAGSDSECIYDVLGNLTNDSGIMSRIYGLHLLNNGFAFGDLTCTAVIDDLLSLQFADGGWALFGEYGDIDVTAMTIQALAPYYDEYSDVQEAIDRGLGFLSEKQMSDGGYQSFGTPNPDSSAQVLTALSALGIDCGNDSRFIKDGCTVIDSMLTYRMPDGGYSHVSGGSVNETATIQVLCSYIAYSRMLSGNTPFYILDGWQEEQTDSDTASETTVTALAEQTVTTETSAVLSTVSTFVSAAASSVSRSVKTTVSAALSAEPTDTAAQTSTAVSAAQSGVYKPTAILIIIGAGAVLSVLLLALGKRSMKNFIFIGAAAAAGIIIVLVTDIHSPDEYYAQSENADNTAGTVTLEIRCDTVADRSDNEYIPDDGTVLVPTEFGISEGDTVCDVLIEAARKYGIQVDMRGTGKTGYVAGINYLYEQDFGDLSGWVFHVNGISASCGCSEYELSDGDVIEWLYTCEIGHDLNEVYEE